MERVVELRGQMLDEPELAARAEVARGRRELRVARRVGERVGPARRRRRFEVDAECRPIGKDGAPSPGLRIVGPPSAGSLGDPLGVPFIAPQIRRMLPGVLAELR